MTIALVTFWLCLGLIVYVYAGYPLLLVVWSRLRPRPVAPRRREPPVSLVLAVRGGAREAGGEAREPARARLSARSTRRSWCRSTAERRLRARGASASPRAASRWCARSATRARRRRSIAAVARGRGELVVFCDARQRAEPGRGARAGRELRRSQRGRRQRRAASCSTTAVSRRRTASVSTGATRRRCARWRAASTRRWARPARSTRSGASSIDAASRGRCCSTTCWCRCASCWRGGARCSSPRARAYDLEAPPDLEFTRKVRTLAGNFQLLAAPARAARSAPQPGVRAVRVAQARASARPAPARAPLRRQPLSARWRVRRLLRRAVPLVPAGDRRRAGVAAGRAVVGPYLASSRHAPAVRPSYAKGHRS